MNIGTPELSLENTYTTDKSDSVAILTESLTTDTDSSSDSTLNFDTHNVIEQKLLNYLKINQINDNFEKITEIFESQIFDSIYKSNNCMLPCLSIPPNENEQLLGFVTVIDIGGSTLRISVVEFLPNKKAQCIINKSWNINNDNKVFNIHFFNWIATNFKSVIDNQLIEKLSDNDNKIKIGLTWSFPIIQNIASNRGIVSDLGKGFSVCDEFKSGDLKDIFENCFASNNIPIKIYTIVNDSISVFISGAYFKSSKLGLVQGTGVNSCMLIDSKLFSNEKKSKLPKSYALNDKLLVNTEASFLGMHLKDYLSASDHEISGIWSIIDNDNSILPPHLTTSHYGVFQPLELLTSGRYIPEIIRRIFINFNDNKKSLFEKNFPNTEYSLTAHQLSLLNQGKNVGFDLIEEELIILKKITEFVIYRASIILVSYIISLVNIGKFNSLNELDISVVGSMLNHFPGYKKAVTEVLIEKSLLEETPNISLDFIEDSSIYGAAISALINEKRNLI